MAGDLCNDWQDDLKGRQESRLQILHIGRQHIVSMLKGELRVLGLPADAVIVCCEWSFRHQAFGILVSSPSFDEVPDGGMIPSFVATVEYAAWKNETIEQLPEPDVSGVASRIRHEMVKSKGRINSCSFIRIPPESFAELLEFCGHGSQPRRMNGVVRASIWFDGMLVCKGKEVAELTWDELR